jgi:hypothetical protein
MREVSSEQTDAVEHGDRAAIRARERIDQFFAAFESFAHITQPYIAVAAIKSGDKNIVLTAKMLFASPSASIEEKVFESPSLRLFTKKLADVQTAKGILLALINGSVDFGDRKFVFATTAGEIAVELNPVQSGFLPQSRVCSISFKGHAAGSLFDSSGLEWELKAADPPYLTLNELLFDYGLAPAPTQPQVEAAHTLPVAIDHGLSRLDGSIARIGIRLEENLPHDKVEARLVGFKPGEPALRRCFKGCELSWTKDGALSVGTVELSVQVGRPYQVIALFAGVAYHFWWLLDPHQVLNPRKLVFETVDHELTLLRKQLTPDQSGGASREFEAAVGWLLWMHGFGVVHIGGSAKAQRAADLLMTTPGGAFALVECTTGVLSVDSKVAKLLSRQAVIAEQLVRSGHNAVKVLPVLVTSKGKEEVVHDIPAAQERGVLVLTRDDLIELLNQAGMLTNPDELFNRAFAQFQA